MTLDLKLSEKVLRQAFIAFLDLNTCVCAGKHMANHAETIADIVKSGIDKSLELIKKGK